MTSTMLCPFALGKETYQFSQCLSASQHNNLRSANHEFKASVEQQGRGRAMVPRVMSVAPLA